MESSFFLSLNRPFIVATSQSVDGFDDYMYALRDNKALFVTIMRGVRMRTFEELNNEVAASLQVPWYFGNNWNAIRDCIIDLGWLGSNAFVVSITNCESVLSKEAVEDRISFGKLLVDASEAWSRTDNEYEKWLRPAQPFHILLHFGDKSQISNIGNIYDTISHFEKPSAR
ncbi:MAG: barstar family protein [Solidesulfovibrio sp.]